jgi:hypothetical protein
VYSDRRDVEQFVDVEGRDGLVATNSIAGGGCVGCPMPVDAVLFACITLQADLSLLLK